MYQFTIVADDSPLREKVQSAFLSESGWMPCGEICDTRNEMPVINFPIANSFPQQDLRSAGRPPFVVITVDKESRLMSYESHFVSTFEPEPEVVRNVRAAVLHVLPRNTQDEAKSLVAELSDIEEQEREFTRLTEPDRVAFSAHKFRERRRQDILGDLAELKESP
jgi:hypothetical protein